MQTMGDAMVKKYDLIVVGTGAALTVLETALQRGQKVAVVERAKFGGTCLNHGCIPTKVMVTAAGYGTLVGNGS